METLAHVFLILTGVFAFLWYVTSPDSTYETVDMDIVHTKKVLLLLAVVFLGFWLAVKFYFSRL